MVEEWEQNYTEAELMLINEEKNAAMWDARAKQDKAHRILWQYIEHNIRRWWD